MWVTGLGVGGWGCVVVTLQLEGLLQLWITHVVLYNEVMRLWSDKEDGTLSHAYMYTICLAVFLPFSEGW